MSFGAPIAYSAVQNTFDIGQQVELVLVSPDGTPIQSFGFLTEFQSTAEKHAIELYGINNAGYRAIRVVEKGWKGTFSFARLGGMADFIQWTEEANYFNGGTQNYYTIYETIREQDGTLTEYQFLGVAITGFDGGTVRQDNEIPMKIDFSAATRPQLNGATTLA